MYIEQFEPDVSKHNVDAQVALKPLIGNTLYLIFCCENIEWHIVSRLNLWVLQDICFAWNRFGFVNFKVGRIHWKGEANSHYLSKP